MNASQVQLLWGFAGFLVLGGMMGLAKGSRISLVISASCAVALALVALRILPPVVAPLEMGGLVGVFAARILQTGKPMPGVPLAAVSALALAGWFLLGRG
ncbi:MAG: TMEM14 family protein [Verrucomicrobiota bacterium]